MAKRIYQSLRVIENRFYNLPEIQILHFFSVTGKYVVGCTDIMTAGDTENGSFCRIFYPTKLKDPYVSNATLIA